jgi:hypothetical protein
MLIKDIFAADITRDIAPVVYFHEQKPQKVFEEVSEYIITGGYLKDDVRRNRVPEGIHEQFVRLLTGLAESLKKSGGVDLPASWISGFYGSGKSSFAKLLGLALDDLQLPDGRSLGEVLLARDDSPSRQQFQQAWTDLRSQIDPIAVVFDIGAVARDDEHIHSAVKREIQRRLNYCSVSHYVADHELKLELDGKWEEFLTCAESTLGEPWEKLKDEQLAEDSFSEVLHVMNPSRYVDPMSWLDSRAGSKTGIGTSVSETTQAIIEMLNHRSPGKTLFVVVDEVSQYVHQDDERMLRLQSFVADLGQKLKGRVWLLATGQQKLEDAEDASSIGKLKDRFPPRLRVHLSPTNIRDVVHKRLLKKSPAKDADLRSLFQQHRADLKLHGYQCDALTEEDFVEVYPLLPQYVDLLMRITSNLRTSSIRAKGDDHAIRGLLQLLGELFREQRLGEQELGVMITLDQIYEVQKSALDPDVDNTLARIFGADAVMGDELALRVAKTVALLQLVQEQEPTTVELVSQCLYERLGQGNRETVIQEKLEKLRSLSFLSYSDKQGYKIQSSAGQEWDREREAGQTTPDRLSKMVLEKVKKLLGEVDNPRYKNRAFRWTALYSDGKYLQDERVQGTNELAVLTVDFRYLTRQEDRNPEKWLQDSTQVNLRDRIIWVAGRWSDLEPQLKLLVKSQHMIDKYRNRPGLSGEKKRLLLDEESRCEDLEKSVQVSVARAFLEGELYFRGRALDKIGSSFKTLLFQLGEQLLPEYFNLYVDVSVLTSELEQLLAEKLSGPSAKFMAGELGILELDVGKYIPTCSGEVPNRIWQHIQNEKGIAGNNLLSYFGGPPYGYSPDVVKACLAGLLRASKIRIRPESGPEITSMKDPGARDMFTKDRDLKRADVLPPSDAEITARDRISICKFFKDYLKRDLDRENDAIADAVFEQFPGQMQQLREVEQRYNQLPNRPMLPDKLLKLQRALEDCMRSRQVQTTVIAVKKHLDDLRDGVEQLSLTQADLTDEAVAMLKQALEVRSHQVSQLQQLGQVEPLAAAIAALEEQLQRDRPWNDIRSLEPQWQAIVEHYQTVRLGLIERQDSEAEVIEAKLKRRKGFSKLDRKKVEYVLRPVQEAKIDTTPNACYPALVEIRDTAILRLQASEKTANTYLDDVLSEETNEQILKVDLKLHDREVSSPEEIEQLVEYVRDQLTQQLKPNTRIRII